MGKMISIQSIAVAVAATGMTAKDESRLFRFTIKHSILLMIVMGLLSMMFVCVSKLRAHRSSEINPAVMNDQFHRIREGE